MGVTREGANNSLKRLLGTVDLRESMRATEGRQFDIAGTSCFGRETRPGNDMKLGRH